MATVTLSPKFQIVIPKEVREAMNLDPGVKIEIVPYESRIELIPVFDIKKLRGALKGIDTNIIREKDREI